MIVEIAFGIGGLEFTGEYCRHQLFGGGFTIASSEANYRYMQLPAVMAGQILEAAQNILNQYLSVAGKGRIINYRISRS